MMLLLTLRLEKRVKLKSLESSKAIKWFSDNDPVYTISVDGKVATDNYASNWKM